MSGRKRPHTAIGVPAKRSRWKGGEGSDLVKATEGLTHGIEIIPRDKIPEDCLGDTEAAQSRRRDFSLRQRTRLIKEGKLVKPGKEMCKFFPDGCSFEWERINSGTEPVTQDTICVDQEISDSYRKVDIDVNTPVPGSSSRAPIVIDVSDVEEDKQYCRGRPRRKLNQENSNESSSDDVRLSSVSTDCAHARNFTIHEINNVPVPKGSYARGRRILIQDKHFVTVSMRGDLQYFNISDGRLRDKALSNPWDPQNGTAHVEDACSIDGYGIIAFNNGTSQAVVVDGTQRIALKQKPHEGGASCLCAIKKSGSRIKFLSGGHDHTVRMWTVDTSTGFTTKVEKLRVFHGSLVHALAWVPTQNHAISASRRTVLLYDMERGAQITKGLASNTIYQMHVQPGHPHIMATEMDHLDRQINLYDLRQGFGAPTCEVGHRNDDSRKPSRYERGSFVGSMFTRGFRDGTIKIFDIRNPNQSICSTLTRRESPVEHTLLFEASTVVAFGGTTLSFVDFLYA